MENSIQTLQRSATSPNMGFDPIRAEKPASWVAHGTPDNPSRVKILGRDGFEPSKAKPADLQSAPVGHLGICPITNRTHSIARFHPLASCATRNYHPAPRARRLPAPGGQFFGASVFRVTIRSTARCNRMSRGAISTGFFRRRCASCIASISGFTPATSAASLMCMRSVS